MIKMPPVEYEVIALGGGLDQITPTLSLKPGVCRDAVNYECLEFGGYGRIGGYERYSGQPAPSAAVYALLYVAIFTNTPTVGQTITNAGATATGYVIAVGSNYIVFTKATGSFATGDTLKVGATVIGTLIDPQGAVSSQLNAQYLNLAANVYRADIANPVGSGPIRGGFLYNDKNYCIRDNAGGTAADLWKESASGWVKITLFKEISFTSGGAVAPADGETLTKGGVTATIKRAVKQTGAWTGSTAAGRFIITNVIGGTFSAGAATASGGATVTLSGAETSITLLPGGKGESVQANFSGQLSTTRIYYVDGVNKCFEFDGTTVVPIVTGVTPDAPKHVAAFKKHLHLAIQSSSFNSNIGDPYGYTAIGGAAEQACGDTITNYQLQPGTTNAGTLTIYCRNNTFMLYGTSAADWNLVIYSNGVGALDYTAQNLAQSFTMDDRGVFALAASLNFGNFESASLTNLIRPFIAEHRTKISCSSLDRAKSQYRLFFKDGYGLYITVVNGKNMGCMLVLFPIYPNVAWEGTLSNGELVKFIGGSDGHVHQMDMGSSFDGTTINAFITFNWAAAKGSRILKRYRKASFEVSGTGYASIDFGYLLGYGTADIQQPNTVSYATPFTPSYWDSFTWDNFTWDGRTLFPTECQMSGTGENVQITLASNSTDFQPFAVNSAILHYSVRRGLR
jgi:hypothetical protein